jgi:hypothetical protein
MYRTRLGAYNPYNISVIPICCHNIDACRTSSTSHTDRPDRSDSLFSAKVRQSIDTLSSAFVSEPSAEEVAVEHRMLDAMQKLNMEMFDEELSVSQSSCRGKCLSHNMIRTISSLFMEHRL